MPKIAVYAGHGGEDPGAKGNGKLEKDLNLAVSNAVSQILRQRGYTILNNRTTDVSRSITRDARKANDSGVDAVVEIHQNSNPGAPQRGSEVYYSVKDTGKGKLLANAILKRIVALGFRDRGVKTNVNANGQDAFGILRLSNAPTVLVECAFINSPEDMARFDVNKMAAAIADGIQEVFPTSVGDQVIGNVQSTLNSRYNAGLTVDNMYGPATKAAMVKGLQQELNKQFGAKLVVDGKFGPATKAAMITLVPGCRGNITYLLQAALYANGYPVTPDSAYGPKTAEAVKAFQRSAGLAADGLAGPNTMEALFR